MTRRLFLFCFLLFLLSACTRPASDSPPTELPLNFPSPAPGSTPLCQPADLQTSSNSNASADGVVLGLTLTNQTKNPCALANPPQVTLLDDSRQPLELQTLGMAPVQTPPAPLEIQLAPGESVIVSLIWRNYCQPLPERSLTIHLRLSETLKVESLTKLLAEPRCAAETEPSTLAIAPYSYPP
jgi:hypothetical protein